MAAMQALGPEMKKLQQKYKGAENRAQMNEEMMKLYKEHNVNPASGCLPMLLQMPAFFVLYSVIRGITNTVTIPAAHGDRRRASRRWSRATIKADPPVHPRSVEDAHRHRGCSRPAQSRSEWTLPQKLLSHHSSHLGGHPVPVVGGRRGRPPVSADVPAQRSEPAGVAGKSASGNAAEIHATHIRVHLSKCGGNSECLFHRFERDPHPDAGNAVPEGHRGWAAGRSHRRAAGAKKGPVVGPDRTGAPEGQARRQRDRPRAPPGVQWRPMERGSPAPRPKEPRPKAHQPSGPRPSRPGRPTDRMVGRERRRARATRVPPDPVSAARRAPPTGATDLGPQTQMTTARPNPRSTLAPRRSVRERPGNRWIGWKRVGRHCRRRRRSSSICWEWLRMMPSSWCSVSPRPACSDGCAVRPGSRPGSDRWPPRPSGVGAPSRTAGDARAGTDLGMVGGTARAGRHRPGAASGRMGRPETATGHRVGAMSRRV